MPVIDQTATYSGLLEQLSKTENPKHREMLERVYEHARCEAVGDLDGVMATLSPKPAYRVWSMPGEAMNPCGTEAIRNFYVNEIFSKGRHCLESTKERVVVDDQCVITEGDIRTVRWGYDLAQEGVRVDDLDACYVQTYRMLIVWPCDDNNLIIGEESWATRGGSPQIEKVDEREVPDSFREYLRGRRTSLDISKSTS